MTDAGGPQRRTLCFLSTLLSQKVPEKSDTVLRCIIAGQPKPEVTWYKNGQTIEDCGIVSSYEFFENQYIHVLHLYWAQHHFQVLRCERMLRAFDSFPCCSKNDAAVYQISAKNCFGMICCSASIEVECSSENPQLSPNLKDDRDTGWKHGTESDEQKGTNQTDEKEHPYKEEGRPSLGIPLSADCPSSTFNPLCSLQLLASNDISATRSESPLDAERMKETEEACDPNNTEEVAHGLLFPNVSHTPDKQEVCCHGTTQSEVPKLSDGALNNDGPNDEDLKASHQNPKVQKYISVSLPLSEAATSTYPGDGATLNEQANSQDSDSDYELCPEITLTYTEEFSDDDLEYLECSDVMTDYSNAVWQRNLQGTESVFLLESDDEVMEFSECCLGECGPFLSEMGSGPRVSGDTGPMEATPGFCGYHSQPQEVRVRRHGASAHSPSSPQTGMTLTLGPHQDGTSTVTDQGRYKPPIALAENDYPGIQGETRDSYQAGEEFASDRLLDVDKAVTEMEVKRLSGELGRPGMDQCMQTTAENRAGEKDVRSKRGSEKPARARRPGIKGKPKKLNPNLKDSAPEGTLNLLYPKEPGKHPLTQRDKRESSHSRAEATGLNSHFRTGAADIPTQAEQETQTPQTPPGALPKEGNLNLEGEGVQANKLFETSWVPDQSDHPQVQIQETVREKTSLSRMPAFSEPAWEESAFTGTTTNSFPDLGGIGEENASLAQCLERESCTQGPQREGSRDREDNAPGRSWDDLGRELSLPEASRANTSPGEPPVRLPQDGSTHPGEPEALSVASPAPANVVPTLETVCHGPRGREGACVVERLEAGDQGTCDATASPVGALVDKYLPQAACSLDLERAGGQSNASDLCSPDDKTLDVLFQTQGSELPQSTCKSNHDRNSVVFPSIGTFTWDISQTASEGATGENPAKMEDSSLTLAPIGPASQERLSPCTPGGLEERPSLSSEKNSFLQFEKGGDDSTSANAPGPTDAPARHRSTVTFPEEKPTISTAHLECLPVTRESGDIPTVTTATEVHPAKYLPVSIAGNSHADGPEENAPQVPDENVFQLPSSVQLGHILNGSTTESPTELLCGAHRGPGVCVCAPRLSEGEGVHGRSPLHIDNQSGDKSPTTDRADSRSLEETVQEKGSETTQRAQQESPPHQGSLSEDHFQESWPTTSAAQGEMKLVPWDHSGDERGQRSGLGTGVSVVAKATVGDDSQAVSSDPPLSNNLLEESQPSGPGHWEAGTKLKIITLEASVSEVWPSRRVTASECREPEAGALIPDGVWAAPDVLRAGAAGPERDPCETTAPAGSPQLESGSALANHRDIHKGEAPASRAHWSSDPSQYLSQPRLLESSVDPVDEQELRVTDLPSEASKTGGQENVNNVSQNQEENQLCVNHPAFFKQFLTGPRILESSVDPIDDTGVLEWRAETPGPAESTPGVIRQERTLNDGNLGQRVDVRPAVLAVPCPQPSGGTIPCENNIDRNQEAGEKGEADQSQHDEAEAEVQPATSQVPCPDGGGETIPSGCGRSRAHDGHEGSAGEAEQSQERKARPISPTLPLSSCLAMTHASVGVDTHDATGQIHDVPKNDFLEPRNHHSAFSDSEERGATARECGERSRSPGGLTQAPFTSSPEGDNADVSISHRTEEPERVELQSGDTKPTKAPGSLAAALAFVSGDCASETAPKTLQDPCPPSPTLGHGRESGEESLSHVAARTASTTVTASDEAKKKQEAAGSGYLTEGVKKKILSRVAALRLRLEEKENARKNASFLKKIPKLETSVLQTDEKKDPQKPPCKREGKAPVLLKKIQAEMFPDHSGNVKLSCQFAEIHEDSTIWWTKDSKSMAQVHRSAGDNSTVSLVIVQASQKDQGLYYCCIKNSYGQVTAEFNLTTEVLKQLSSHQDITGCEEIEFSQLIFKEDFLHDSYFGARLRGQIATEALHFGEGVHRKAFRSKVMQGLLPVFQPGHACVLKVHNAVASGTRNNDELVQRNYKLAAQECYVQNTARYYAKIYAAEAQPLEGFGEVPEIIPIFLIHRPENNIPYATVEEELIGEFVKYSIRDGKEINFLRRESEAGQKCCTFQHWVYQKTGGCLLVTDMQGVGMKLTDVGIATLAKGYKGFKGNCSMTFIDQFKVLHQCNKYCKMLGLKPLQNNQKQKKPSVGKNKIQPNSTTVKKMAPGTPAEKKT